MKFYANITSERDSRAGKKGGNEYLQIELSAFGKSVGYVVLEITQDTMGEPAQYLLKYAPRSNPTEWAILKVGHKTEGAIKVIQA